MKVYLVRDTYSDEGTFGTLTVNDTEFISGELPWRDNKRSISCIPVGVYECSYTYSPKFKRRLYAVTGVKDRAGIRIHSANFCGDQELGYKSQLNGCITLGKRLGILHGQKAILDSRSAVIEFEKLLDFKPFTLIVTDGGLRNVIA